MLLNQMLPPLSNQNDQLLKDKHTFLTDNSDLVLLLGIDVLPKLMQVFNSGERVDLSNVCLSLIFNLIHWATPKKLENLLEENNISRFLSGAYNYKDLHVLMSALRLTALLLQSLPTIFYSFNREGVLYGIDNILSKASGSSSSDQDPSPECQCYLKSFQANAQTVLNCSLEEGCVYHLSQKIKDEYIASNSSGLREGSRKVSELTSKLDGYMKQANDDGAVEKGMNDTIQEILKVFTEESISVFDLIRLGTLTSLVEYISAGRGLEGYDDAIEKRFEYFATVCSSNHTLLLSALQSALMYFESFPVIVIGKKETWVDAPQEGLVTSPSMKIRFFNDIEDDMGEEEDQSEEEEDQFVAVDPFSSLKEIQQYLFKSGYAKKDKQHDELIFHLEGKELDRYVTLYQAIIGQKIQWNEDFSVDQLWEKEHTLRFTRVPSSSITTPAAAEYDQSSFFRHMFCYEPVPDLKKLSPVHEILFLLKLLEGTNRLMPHIMCRQRIETFASSEDANMLEFHALASRKKHLPSAQLSFRGSRIEDLCLTFTSVPGCPDTDLFSTDSDINENNLGEYVSLVTDATVRSGISRQMEAFKSGLNLVFPIKYLHIFTEEELEHILCGEQDSWTQSNELENHLEFGQGYTARSPPIINLISIIQEFDGEQKKSISEVCDWVTSASSGRISFFISENEDSSK